MPLSPTEDASHPIGDGLTPIAAVTMAAAKPYIVEFSGFRDRFLLGLPNS